jgi:hypothetical protein
MTFCCNKNEAFRPVGVSELFRRNLSESPRVLRLSTGLPLARLNADQLEADRVLDESCGGVHSEHFHHFVFV